VAALALALLLLAMLALSLAWVLTLVLGHRSVLSILASCRAVSACAAHAFGRIHDRRSL
jgi:hypothetical protein